MKNKNQAFHWFSGSRHVPRIGMVIFFVVASLLSWLLFSNYIAAAWSTSANFFSNENSSSENTSVSDALPAESESSMSFRSIDGLAALPEDANLIAYAVMVENLQSVRPQSGLGQAAVVYEALAEGGSTRFMALFDPRETVTQIMPVRSARPYYLEWVSEYGALYAHAGGSPKALTVIWENPDINNLDALSGDAKYFWRDTSLYAPHNLVTSSEKMNFALRDKGFAEKTATFQSWKYKDSAALSERGVDGKTASFNFSYGLTYQVDFRYRRDTNTYLRSNANAPHLDKNTGAQIEVTNVIVQLVDEPALDGGKGRLDINVGGEGSAWIFRDGQAIAATWKKSSRTDRTLFFDSNGKEIELNRGNTWIHVIPKGQEVTYQ